jgi:hypothetical protein
MATIVLQAPNKIGLRQPIPREGFNMYPVNAPGNGGIPFVTGNELYQFDSFGNGYAPPSAILSMWVDASGITTAGAAKNVYLDTPDQHFVVPLGSQGYVIITEPSQAFRIKVSADAAAAGTFKLILYNYNVFFTGNSNPGSASAGGQAGGSGGSGGGQGGGGSQMPGQSLFKSPFENLP